MVQRILLLGKDGQVGYELQRALAPLGEVIAIGRRERDLADADAAGECVRNARADLIVNAAAYTAVDKAETDHQGAYALNARLPEIVGRAAGSALVIHYSTDYVFDGSKRDPHVETDAPNPGSVYGASKLEGEQALQKVAARAVVLRTSWVFGLHGANFLKTMLRLGRERDHLRVVGDQRGAPTPAWLIADVTAQIIGRARVAPIEYGLYHLAPRGATTWYDYAQFAFAQARERGFPLRITPERVDRIGTNDYPLSAARPANSLLDVRKLEHAFDLRMPAWEDGVIRAVEALC